MLQPVWVLCAALFLSTVLSISPQCYTDLGAPGIAGGASAVTCKHAPNPDLCFLLCGACSTPEISLGFDSSTYFSLCTQLQIPEDGVIVSAVSSAVYNVSELQGFFWLDDPGDVECNATVAIEHLFATMPRRDMQLLFNQPFQFLDFLFEHVRYALLSWPTASAAGVPWDVFLDYVLPYAVLDEPRDLQWRWRPRFAQLFGQAAWVNATTVSQAAQNLAALIPFAQAQGVMGYSANGLPPQYVAALSQAGAQTVTPQQLVLPGRTFNWKSGTAPAYLSPSQVAAFGASCTGTGILLVLAARSAGIPSRLAGCSQSIVEGDDHHWAEFYDPSSPGPFSDGWHTREGVSAGNPDGPWDAPSGPMLNCLKGVQQGSQLNTLWASQWSSSVYLPTLWADSPLQQQWAFQGGVNRCGAYCSAWGCGVNNTDYWTQEECGPVAVCVRGSI